MAHAPSPRPGVSQLARLMDRVETSLAAWREGLARTQEVAALIAAFGAQLPLGITRRPLA